MSIDIKIMVARIQDIKTLNNVLWTNSRNKIRGLPHVIVISSDNAFKATGYTRTGVIKNMDVPENIPVDCYNTYVIKDVFTGLKFGESVWLSSDVDGHMLSNIFSILGYWDPGSQTVLKQKLIGNMNAEITVKSNREATEFIITDEDQFGIYSNHVPFFFLHLLSRTPRKQAKEQKKQAERTPVVKHEDTPLDEDAILLDAVKTLVHLSGEQVNGKTVDYVLYIKENGYTRPIRSADDIIKYADRKKHHVNSLRDQLAVELETLQKEIQKLN